MWPSIEFLEHVVSRHQSTASQSTDASTLSTPVVTFTNSSTPTSTTASTAIPVPSAAAAAPDDGATAVAARAATHPPPTEFVVTYRGKAKLHGTNAGVQITPDGVVYAQSRRRRLCAGKQGDDNHGFADWVHSHEAFFAQFQLFAQACAPHRFTIFGEWIGNGIQTGAAVCAIRQRYFALFGIRFGEVLLLSPDGIQRCLAYAANELLRLSSAPLVGTTLSSASNSKKSTPSAAASTAKSGKQSAAAPTTATTTSTTVSTTAHSKNNHGKISAAAASSAKSNKKSSSSSFSTTTAAAASDPTSVSLCGALADLHVISWLTPLFTVNLNADVDSPDEQTRATTEYLESLVAAIDKKDAYVERHFNVSGPGEGLVAYPVSMIDDSDRIPISVFESYAFKAKGLSHRMVHKPKCVQLSLTVPASVSEFLRQFLTPARVAQGIQEACNGVQSLQHLEAFCDWMAADVKKESVHERKANSALGSWESIEPAVRARARLLYEQL